MEYVLPFTAGALLTLIIGGAILFVLWIRFIMSFWR